MQPAQPTSLSCQIRNFKRTYRVLYGFGQAKFAFGSLVLGLSLNMLCVYCLLPSKHIKFLPVFLVLQSVVLNRGAAEHKDAMR